MQEPSTGSASYKDKVRKVAENTGGYADKIEDLKTKLTEEANAQQIVADALKASADAADVQLAAELEKAAEELKRRRDDIIVEALSCGAGDVDKETKKLAKEYSDKLKAKIKELERISSRNIKQEESLNRLQEVAQSINLKIN